MDDQLITHVRRFTPVNEEDAVRIISYFSPLSFAKKEIICEQGERCKYNFFVKKGCLRMFYHTEKGIDQTVQFAIENWWLSDYLAFEQQRPSVFAIQAVEYSEVLAIDYRTQDKLLQDVPLMERYFRLLYQRAYGATQNRMKYLTDHSKEEAYRKFHNSFPEFTTRVPQQLLASYLHMTPEYLSEIKRRLKLE